MTSPDAIDDPSEPVSAAGGDPLRLGGAELKALLARRDAPAWWRLAGHLALMAAAGWLWLAHWYPLPGTAPLTLWIALPALVLYGLCLATMFAPMHECVHRTAFRTNALNDAVGWGAGLLSFYNSTFYRHYHGWHHRFTQQAGNDPELDDPKPRSLAGYIVEIGGLTWWYGKVRGHLGLAFFGQAEKKPYIPAAARAEVVRSERLQVAVYAVAIAASALAGSWWFVLGWVLPLAVGEPFLRVFTLSEHTGTAEGNDRYANTRTTYTNALIDYLMWEMPYHAEHHRFPALPFHALRRMHAHLKPHLAYIAGDGYLGVQRRLLRALGAGPG